MPQFERYIGIDYSGAKTPVSRLPGLRVYSADRKTPPHGESAQRSDPRKNWTRRDLAHWLGDQLSGEEPTLVGIDHAFSFPRRYFEKYRLQNWPAFLDDFQTNWPTDNDQICVNVAQQGEVAERTGDKLWLRLTEKWTATAKSVFRFGVPGQVATSTHAGLPWLRYLRRRHLERLRFWPFDCWEIPKGYSVLAEVYPSLWMNRFQIDGRNSHQQAAYATAAWLQRADRDDSLSLFFNPPLEHHEKTMAEVEGWILGVT